MLSKRKKILEINNKVTKQIKNLIMKNKLSCLSRKLLIWIDKLLHPHKQVINLVLMKTFQIYESQNL